MVEELKLAIKVDDDAIEQSLLKQFANAEKMANKVVLTFNNIDLDDKAIEAKFKEMQKMAGKNPIDLSIDKSSIEMLSAISKQLGNIFDIAKGKSLIDSSVTVADINKITNAINGLNSSLSKSNTSALQEEEKQIQKNIDSIKKLLDLKYEVKNVNKSSYSGKGNIDWIGIYKSQEEAISSDLSDRKEKLHSSLNLILSEDKNALSSLEEEATKLKIALQSVQEMSNRISSNSSISDLDKNKGSEEWYKGYAEAYKAIDDRLGELNNQYRLTNEELEEYITLQVKAEKIMDKMVSHNGGVQGSGAKNKAELKSWIEKSFATDLGLNPEDIYRGLFGNITDALYDGNGISLFDSEGAKRSLREISAEILNYKSTISGFSGSFGANEDAEKLREINSILNYIKNNASEIESTDFSSQIKKASELVDYYSQKLSEGEHTDFYSKSLKDAQDDLQNLISLQERLNATKDKQTNEIITEQQSSSLVEQQNTIQEELKETQKQAEQTSEALSNIADGNKSDISSENIANQIVENEKKKQEAYKATADAVMYHAGVVSKLNKADTNGRFYGSDRGTGYFGTGHYFVDSATKHELDNSSSYSKLPYTSIDISQYDNLFKATTNEIADGLHTFLKNLTKFTQGNDLFSISELFSQFQKVFGETVMDIQEFDAKLNQLKTFMQNSSMDDRSDSVSTQFMKSLGYGGVDTRGTKYADTRYGTVIYDLKEESILQANITDELQKQGQMLEKINYEKGQVFDKSEDTRIQGILDQQEKSKEIDAEFNKLYDSTQLKAYESELDSVNNKLKENDNIISECSSAIANADEGAKQFAKEMKALGLEMSQEEIANTANQNRESYQTRIDELEKERPLLEARKQELEQNLQTEYELANAARERAKAIVEERNSPIEDVFQGDDKVNTDASTTAIKEESQALEQVSTSAKDAATSKEKFANANKEVKASAESSSTSLDEEKKKIENVGDSAEETKKKLDDVVFKPNTEGFDEIVSKLDIAKDKIEEISKITKSSVWSESQGEYLESYNIKYKNGTSEIRGESSNKKGSNVLRANEVAYDVKAAEQEAKAVKEVWDKNVKAIQDYMDAVTKLNNLNAKDKGSGKYASQIALQEKNVEELKEKALEARTAITSMINPHDVPLNTWRDYLDVMKKFDQASLGSAESVAKLEDALRKMDFSSLESASTKFESQFKNLSIKPDGDHQFLSWTNDLKELNAKIDEYNSKVKYLKENNIVDGEQVDEVKNLRDEIEQTINVMTKTPQTKRGWTDIGASNAAEKVANILKQNTKMSKEARNAIKAYYDELRSGNPSQPIADILAKVNQLVQKERELGRVGKSFGEIFKEKVIYGGAAQLAGMVGFYDVINVGKEGFQTIRELDTALTEMKKVSDETTQSLKNYQATTFDVGDTVGATAKTIQESTADWMRLGESINESAESAKASNILLNVSEFESIDEATESLVAMSQAYSELGKMDIIDVLNNIGNNYSIATDGLATALQKSASALKTANNDLNSAVALATAGNAVVQDPDSVGAGIRTISLRLVGTEAAKQELESIGEETDDVITTTSKLRDTILSATAAATNDGKGFDIFDSNGNYKSTYEIMQGLADLYDDIVAKDKELGTNNLNLLLETIAGKNRSNIAASILQNGEMLRSVYQDAQNSSGSAQKELDSYLDSIDGRMTQLENRAQEFWYKVIDSDAIKNGITLLTDLLELGTNIVDTFGVLPTIMAGVGAGLGIKNLGKTYEYTVFKLNCFGYALYA